MGVALGLIAIVLAGAVGEPNAGGEKVEIQYTVCFLETEGMGWREAVFTRLTPVTRQGAATVWTAPGQVKPRLLQQAIADRTARPVQAAAFKAGSGAPAHFQVRGDRYLVTQVAWDGNDRPEGGKPEAVRTGPVGTMAGRKMDQGVLVQLVLEDTEVRAVHHLNLPRPGEHSYQAATGTPRVQPEVFIGQGKAAGLTAYATPIPLPLAAHIFAPSFADAPKADRPCPEGTIGEIRIEGNTTIPAEKIKSKLLCRTGQPLDWDRLNVDINALWKANWFSSVSVFFEDSEPNPGKFNLTFEVHEKPNRAPADRLAETINRGISTSASTDCACEKDAVIRARLDTTSPASACCASPTSTATPKKRADASTVSIEVPEIASQEIAGEWLIPKDGILLVSFGPHTVADKDGKAVIRERLAILEAVGVDEPAVRRTAAAPGRVPSPAPMATDVTATPRPIPAPVGTGIAPGSFPSLPSRSIPQGVHADGTPAELPPLPADDPEDAPSSDSAEPRPSPQIKKVLPSPSKPVPVPAPDPQMKRTGFSRATSMLSTLPSIFLAANPTVGLQFLMPVKAVSFKLPFNRKLEIEVFGRIVRNPEPVEPPAELVIRPKASESR